MIHKEVIKTSLGLGWLIISIQFLSFLFMSYSFPIHFLFMSHVLFILVPFISKVIQVINKGEIKIRAWVMCGYNQQVNK